MFDFRTDTDALLEVRKKFERYYTVKNPRPKARTSAFVLYSLAVLVLASIIVSCSHTIPAFLATIEGDTPDAIKVIVAIAAFLMVEAALLVFSYTNVLWQNEADSAEISRDTVRKRLKVGLYSVLVLAVGANLYSTLLDRFQSADWWDIFSFGVFVFVGASAPALAYIAGEVVAITALLDRRENAGQLAIWQDAQEAEWDKVLARFNRAQLRGGQTPIAIERPVQTDQTDDQTDRQTPVYQTFEQALADRQPDTRQTPARPADRQPSSTDAADKFNRAVRHYEQNPSDIHRSPREVGKELVPAIGKDTMYAARAEVMGRAKIDGDQPIQ
jgi:hypothetical protein